VHDIILPNSFLRISDAVAVLVQGMYAGFHQPKPLHKIKLDYQKASVAFGPWKEQAAQLLQRSASAGGLRIYVMAATDAQPTVLPPEVVGRLMTIRGGLPDRSIRPTIKAAGGDAHVLQQLRGELLLVCQKDLVVWYRSERKKRRWPSQRLRKKRGVGRPSKITASVRTAVMESMASRKLSIAALHRDLIASGRTDVPSVDTLERLIDQLYSETGRPEFFRKKRFRRKRS
jgi:hypothetical protein